MATGGTNSCSLSTDNFNEVSLACKKFSSQWQELAKHLNVNITIVQGIDAIRSGRDTVWCLDQLILYWLCQTSRGQPKPKWRLLCDAIANINRPLSEKIWEDHTRGCGLCRGVQTTPDVMAGQQNDTTQLAAKKLSSSFDELVDFMMAEIKLVNVDTLRLHLARFFRCEEELNDEVDRHLMKIEDCFTSEAVLNYFVRHDFLGYINYSLIKVFQKIAKSPLLDKRIEQYEKEYERFLELNLVEIYKNTKKFPDLRPKYPAGMPKFTIHLQSEWDGKSMLDLKEFLKKCFNSDCVDQLMIAKISRNCIIIAFAVLPHIARKILAYLTNDNVILSMKKEGISIEITKQLLKYKEFETTSMEQTSGTLLGLETDPTSQDLEGVTRKETVDMLRKQIKSLESQLLTYKQMMMELDNTRDELQKTKQSLSLVQEELVSMKRKEDQRKESLNDELRVAAKNGDTDRIDILVKSGAYVNATSFQDSQRRTPLHIASSNGHCEAVNLLISLGAELHLKDDEGNTPLHDASYHGHSKVVDILLSHGATVNEKNDDGHTSLHEASLYGHSDVVDILLSHGANVNEKNKRGSFSLHWASRNTHSGIVSALLSHGAIVNSVDKIRRTPLHKCLVRSDNRENVQPQLKC